MTSHKVLQGLEGLRVVPEILSLPLDVVPIGSGHDAELSEACLVSPIQDRLPSGADLLGGRVL